MHSWPSPRLRTVPCRHPARSHCSLAVCPDRETETPVQSSCLQPKRVTDYRYSGLSRRSKHSQKEWPITDILDNYPMEIVHF